jgi:hypothetical protein
MEGIEAASLGIVVRTGQTRCQNTSLMSLTRLRSPAAQVARCHVRGFVRPLFSRSSSIPLAPCSYRDVHRMRWRTVCVCGSAGTSDNSLRTRTSLTSPDHEPPLGTSSRVLHPRLTDRKPE